MQDIEGHRSRREILAGAAAVAAASVLPGELPQPVIGAPPAPVLWPTDTQLQRQAVIVRTMIDHIAEVEQRPKETVTTDDIWDRVRYFGMSREETVAAEAEMAKRMALCASASQAPDRA